MKDSQSYISLILSEEIQTKLIESATEDVYQFLLKNQHNTHIALLAEQLEGRQKSKHKLPHWYNSKLIVFPPRISMEQCSSELTAIFKANLVFGKQLLDLTGGFGVDDWAFSKTFDQVYYVEQQSHLSAIAAHNFKVLNCTNVHVTHQDSISFLNQCNLYFDCIYVDPARRKEHQKVFKLSDCEPNMEEILPLLWGKSNQILIKCSPLLDIEMAAKSLTHISKIVVLAVDNDCKELLFLLDKHVSQEVLIQAVNLKTKGESEVFEFTKNKENTEEFNLGLPRQYVYEPNVAVLKSGAFKSVSSTYNVYKLHANTHLYTSEEFCPGFPGRKFQITDMHPFSKKTLKKLNLPLKANLTIRNFPYTIAELRKLTSIKDGGDDYIFFTTLMDGSLAILRCKKL